MGSGLETKLKASSLPALDGLRAVAVFLVIGLHLGYSRIPGYLGVLIFFVLSGFLITWLLLREWERTGGIALRDFYRRRMLRIFPAFYCFWIVHLLYVKWSGAPMETGAAVSAFFYVSNYYYAFPVPLSGGLTHTWSLGVEEQFYLLWPWVFVWQVRHLNRLARWLILAILGVQLWRPFLLYVLKAPELRYPNLAFDARCDALLIGCLLAILLKTQPANPLWILIGRSAYAPLPPLAVLAGTAYVNWRWRSLSLAVGLAVAAYAFAVLMIQLIQLSDRAPWSWLNWPPARFLGKISYPMYLYHLLTIKLGMELTQAYPLPIRILVALAFTVAGASLSYLVVERPFLALKTRSSTLWRRHQPAAL